MAFRKKTKIVCTMGPATEDEEVLRQLILHGMNVARFNFSHGSHEYHRTMIEKVRSLSDELGIPVAILLDTKGPEVRTGVLADGKKVTLETGKTCVVTTDDDVIGTAERFSLDYKNLPSEVEKGSVILIDDGLIGLEVDHVEGNDMHCVITNGGELGEHKGVNVPNVNIGLPSVTAQDRADIMFGCELGIDAIAASFIRDGEAVEEIRKICLEMGSPTPPTASWSPVATWASRSLRLRSRTSRRPSSRSAPSTTSRSSPPPRCSTPCSATRARPVPRSPTSPTPSTTAPTA